MMKTIPIALTLCLATLSSACIGYGTSSFFSNFSVRQLIKGHEANTGLACDPNGGGGGGGGTIGTGGFGFGWRHIHAHKGDAFACRLSPDAVERFDDAGLLAALKIDVQKALNDSGAKITESGNPDPQTFYFKYTLKDVQGRVQVSGRRFGNDYYSLSADLDENK
jgi:hypothetical protein